MSPGTRCTVRKGGEPHGEQLYAARREKEWKQQQFSKQVTLMHAQAARRTWEDHSDLKRRDADGRLRDVQQAGRRSDMLQARRCQLRDKLEREESELYAELTQPDQTPDERRDAVRRKLETLRAERERERQAFAQQMDDLRFRRNCDELRCATSHAHAQEVRCDRDAQLLESRQLDEEARAQEVLHHQVMMGDVRAFGEESAALAGGLKEAELMRMQVLDKQQAYREQRRHEEAEVARCDAAELTERLAKMRADEEEEAREQKTREHRCREELLADMATRRATAERERLRDLEAEREICARDNEDRERETTGMAARRAAHARGMDEYRAYLRDARLAEEAAEREVAQLVQVEAGVVYRRQRELWLAEQQRRQCLLQETIDIRKKQVENRLARALEERAVDRAYHRQLALELDRLQRLEEERLQQLRLAEREYAADLQAQASYGRRQQEELRREDERLAAAGAQAETEYQRRLDQCLLEKLCERPHPWRAQHKYYDVVTPHPAVKE